MKLIGLDDQIMAMAAHRYCLGRQTYVVNACVDWLRATWAEMEPNTQNVMLRDTLEALTSNRAGAECDVRDWTSAAAWMWQNMTPEQRDWTVRQTNHLNDPFRFLQPNAQAHAKTRREEKSDE